MHISATSLQLYWRCPELYRKVYVTKELEREPQTPEMAVGTANHAAIDFMLKKRAEGTLANKWPNGGNALLASALTVAHGTLSTCFKNMIVDAASAVVGAEDLMRPMKLILDHAVTAFHRQMLPYSNPMASEMPITKPWATIDGSQGVDVKGAIDWVDKTEEGIIIADVKTGTTEKTPDRDSAARSFQLPFYAIMYHEMTGVWPKFGCLHHFVNSKRPHYTSRIIEITPNLIRATVNKVNATIAAIRAGIFPPGDAYFSCNESRCRAWLNCPMGGAHE